MKRLIVVLFAVVSRLPCFAGAEDEIAFDLRGPDPKPGLTLREVSRWEMKGADVTLKERGELPVTVKMDVTTVEERETTIKATEGRTVTKFTTRIVKDETTTSLHGPEETETQEDLGALSGQVVTSEKTKSAWKHTLADGEPSKEQKEALADMCPWDDDECVPVGKQNIGASWEMDAVHIKKVLGESWTAASGKLKVTFTGVKKHNGELCAVIEATGSIKGKLKSDGNEKVATMGMQITDYRSLKHGITIKSEAVMSLKASGKEMIEDRKVDVVIQGNVVFASETTVRD